MAEARNGPTRATVVTGMPSTSVISSTGRTARWARMPGRLQCRGAVTSRAFDCRMRQSPAAARWLRTVPAGAARTAAIHRPRIERTR